MARICGHKGGGTRRGTVGDAPVAEGGDEHGGATCGERHMAISHDVARISEEQARPQRADEPRPHDNC